MNAGELAQTIRYTINLKDGLAQQMMRGNLVENDRAANRVVVAVMDGKEEADLSGVAVTGGFIRPVDSAEIPLSGSVNGNEASVTLEDVCYEQAGTIEIFIRLSLSGITRTILTLTGNVIPKGSGAYVDITGAIPSVEDIIAQYAEMKAVTKRTIEAAQRAENLTIDASGLAMDAKRLGGKPPEAFFAVDLLDNSDFGIAQAGYNAYHGSTMYLADRWITTGESTVSKVQGGISITPKENIVGSEAVWQYVGKDVPLGTKLTAAMSVDGVVYVASGTLSADAVTIDTPFGRLYYQYSSSKNRPYVQFNVNGGKSVVVNWVALYEGSYTADTLPPYVPKGYAAELAECQRYCVDCSYGRADDWSIGFVTSSSYVMIPLYIPVTMRSGVVPSPINLSNMQLFTGDTWVNWPSVSPTYRYTNNTMTLQSHTSVFNSAGVTLSPGQIFMIKNLPLLSADL